MRALSMNCDKVDGFIKKSPNTKLKALIGVTAANVQAEGCIL